MFGNRDKGRDTSWQKVSKWYGEIVGERGHFFHQEVIFPKGMILLEVKKDSKVLDIACGTGVLSRYIDSSVPYVGVDKAKDLIIEAQKRDKNKGHKYLLGDVTIDIPTKEKFNRAAIVLALQNIKDPAKTLKNIASKLESNARLLIVLNHPVFRIPRQTSWEEDKTNKMQYRRINRYLSPLEIPINAHPSQQNSPVTWSYHYSIEDYSKFLFEAGFFIEKIEEWTSTKQSEGRVAKQENRAREEFPMFMAILAIKK